MPSRPSPTTCACACSRSRDRELTRAASGGATSCRRAGDARRDATRTTEDLRRALARLRAQADRRREACRQPRAASVARRRVLGCAGRRRPVGESSDECPAEAPGRSRRVGPSRRRARIAAAMAPAGGGVAIVPTAPERQRNRDNDFPYRHDSYFHYLTGFTEPQAWLRARRATAAARCSAAPKDPEREIWDGYRLGPEAAPAALGVDEAYPIDELDAQLPRAAGEPATRLVPVRRPRGPATRASTAGSAAVRARACATASLCPQQQRDLCPLLDEMRLVKDAHEHRRRCAAPRTISAGAHVRAMRFGAQRLRDGAGERARVRPRGRAAARIPPPRRAEPGLHLASSRPAPTPACCTTPPATRRCAPASWCLIDAGCELDGYASDITRTFPADGRFSGAAARAVRHRAGRAGGGGRGHPARRAPARPARRRGARAGAGHARRRPARRATRSAALDDVIEKRAYRQFYMHGTGHWLGLDVHDVGELRGARRGRRSSSADGLGGEVIKKPSRILQPGMVLTIEPGLYVRPAEGVPEQFRNIGIRIEDDAIVTDRRLRADLARRAGQGGRDRGADAS